MKFLVVRFSSIGDIVLTTPVVRGLKQQVKNAEVHYLTKKNFASILIANPYIDKVHILENDLSALIADLKNEKFDAIIDLHNNLRSARVKWGIGVKAFSFNKLNFQKWLLVRFGINRLPPVHIVDRYLQTVSSFGVMNDKLGLDYFIPEKDEVDVSSVPHREYVALVVGAAHATKRLPLEKMQQLVSQIKYPIILLGGKEDREMGEQIRSSNPSAIYNACGIYNLNQSASLVKNARVVISHDTGLMHIAAAFHKPIISVWGNTVPEFGMYPYLKEGEFSMMAEVKGLSCRPCSKIGYEKCPLGHFKCMNEQDIALIAEAIEKVKNQK